MLEMYSIYTKEDWIEKIKNMAKDNTWREQIGINNRGEKIEYVKNENAVKRIAAFGTVATCYSDEIVDAAVCEVLEEKAEEIVEWILSDKPVMKLSYNADEAIGYEINKEGIKTVKNTVQVTLRKTSTTTPEIGFFISSVIPV